MAYWRVIFLALLVITLDQAVKYSMIDMMQQRAFMPLEITPFFNIVMVWNKGVSFGILSSADARHGLIVLSLCVVSGLFWWHRKTTHILALLGVGCIAGGALGNVIDRIRYRAVADFFDVHLFGYHWPAFNIADMSIVCGVCCLCYLEWKISSIEKKKSLGQI
jgi:signal peptidase II